MKIVTWNINGIKARLDGLLVWLQEFKPDIVCLQEIKSVDDQFPRLEIEALGYHVETHGQKSFNGVALLSKKSPEEVIRGLPGDDNDEQARFIEGTYCFGKDIIRVASIYLPNGNPVESDKYPYKMNWMKRLEAFTKERLKLEEPMVLAGDYNVISTSLDAKKPNEWINDALFLPKTRTAFHRLLNLGLVDAIRTVEDRQLFSFWDYQAGAWQKDNGILIDHLLLSPEAADKLHSAFIQKEVRGWDRPSDHVPVWLSLNMDDH